MLLRGKRELVENAKARKLSKPVRGVNTGMERSVTNSPVSGCGISLSFVVALFIEEAFQLQKKTFTGYIFVATVKIKLICYQMSYCLATK